MTSRLLLLLRLILGNARDMLPVILVVAFFQYVIVGLPLPNLASTLAGAIMVLVGLTLFVQGLSMSLFPLGESLVEALAVRANIWLLMAFAFFIGFGSTFAEPALIAVTNLASEVSFAEGGPELIERNALILRYGCALAVGIAVMLGGLKILLGWRAHWLVLGVYGLTAIIAVVTDSPLTAVAFDAGSAATSAINVPLISAFGVGLATMIRGRNPMTDGFGIVALCSAMPMATLLIGSQFLMGST